MELIAIDWLPEPNVAMARCRAAAAADALLSPDVDLRQYWCTKDWKPGIDFARRLDSDGSHAFVVQSGDTTVIKVAVVRRSMGPDALARFQKTPTVELPPLAIQVLNEPDFYYQELSFLAWHHAGKPWVGLNFRVDNINSIEMGKTQLQLVCNGAKTFYVYAQTYHEVTIDPPSLSQLFKQAPLSKELAEKIAPGVSWKEVKPELERIGYPLA